MLSKSALNAILSLMTEKETLENTRRKLIFRSGHRGTKEMDLILGNFSLDHVPNFTLEEIEMFEQLLTENDPDLYNWIMGREDVPEASQSPIMDMLLAYDFASKLKSQLKA